MNQVNYSAVGGCDIFSPLLPKSDESCNYLQNIMMQGQANASHTVTQPCSPYHAHGNFGSHNSFSHFQGALQSAMIGINNGGTTVGNATNGNQ